MTTDDIIEQVRRGYSGQGGPLTPLSLFDPRRGTLSRDTLRANRILNQMDRLNLYRIAAQKAPFASPLKDRVPLHVGLWPLAGAAHACTGTDFAAPERHARSMPRPTAW